MSEEDIQPAENDQFILISGASTTGKSASLRNIRNQERWMYLNAEAGKRLPFRNKFDMYRISDPWQVYEGFNHAIENPNDFDGIIIDTVTFLMDMFESQNIYGAKDTQKGWADFSQYFKNLMQQKVVLFGKPVIVLAHTLAVYDESALEMKTAVPIKGALKNNGVEAYFSTVVSTKRMPLKELSDFKPELDAELLRVNEDDELVGFKHVFQTRLTKKTTGERIRSPMGLFNPNQTYMDNDAQLLLDHLHEFYNG